MWAPLAAFYGIDSVQLAQVVLMITVLARGCMPVLPAGASCIRLQRPWWPTTGSISVALMMMDFVQDDYGSRCLLAARCICLSIKRGWCSIALGTTSAYHTVGAL
jgi:hypothetical protein